MKLRETTAAQRAAAAKKERAILKANKEHWAKFFRDRAQALLATKA